MLLGEKCLVTGAFGFVGRHLVGQLVRDKVQVVSFTRNRSPLLQPGVDVDVVVGDVRDSRATRAATVGCTTVFHLAGPAHNFAEVDNEDLHQEVTVTGTKNLLSAARENGVQRFVFLSTLSVYSVDGDTMRDETSLSIPASAYGRAKLAAEQHVMSAGLISGMHVCCLRPAVVYGQGCRGNLSRMITMIDRGLFTPPPQLKNKRSMVHISDLVQAMILAARSSIADRKTYIVTDDQAYSTREVYEAICRGLGKPVPGWGVPVVGLKVLARAGDVIGKVRGKAFLFDSDVLEKFISNAWYSSEKIARELGYQPRVTFEEALPEMIAWYRRTRVQSPC